MVYNDTANKLGIVQEIDDLCDTDSTSYPVSRKTRRVNTAYEKRIAQIITMDGGWQFDDSNYTDLPIGVSDLEPSQNDYSFASDVLEVERVEVLDESGIWHLLKPIDKSQIKEAIAEFQKEDGLPRFYDKQGSSIFLYPAPATGSVTLTGGLKVYFQRTASLFTAADTTKQPGFASPFHAILAYDAAIPHCMTYKKDRVALYQLEADKLEKAMLAFYSRRSKDERKQITMRQTPYV